MLFCGRAENNYRFLLFADSCFFPAYLSYSLSDRESSVCFSAFFQLSQTGRFAGLRPAKSRIYKKQAHSLKPAPKKYCAFLPPLLPLIYYIYGIFGCPKKKFPFFESSQESKRNRSPYLLNYKHKEKKESHSSVVRYNKNERTKHYVRSQKG